MLHTTKAVVLRTIAHGDRTRILKTYTEQFGSRSYMVRTGKGGVAQAALQPLSRVELVVTEHTERDIHTVREMRVAKPYMALHTDPVRGALALFTQELLYKVLREESSDQPLYDFVEEALEAIDTAPEIKHFPLVFMIQLTGHLGFYPESPSPSEDRFDLKEGHYVSGASAHGQTMNVELSAFLATLLGVDLGTMHTVTSPLQQRRDLLDHLLLYYRLHVAGMGEIRSPEMLKVVLG